MDPDTALELVKKGSSLLLLDVPQRTLVGIDTKMFSVGPKFKGIKMIPPGPHFVYYSPSDREGNAFSAVVGFFFMTSASEVIVRKWNHQEELLTKLPEEEEVRYCEAVRHFEFDSELGPYPLDNFGMWKKISNYITSDTIERIEPIGGEISIAYESESIETKATSKQQDQPTDAKSEGSVKQPTKRHCYYTPIPRVVKRKDTSNEELTALNLDKTGLLETILQNNFGGSEDLLLGELQFAFIAFLMGQSLEAFNQWKALTTLLLSCTTAPLHSRSRLFSAFIRVIYYQIKYGFCDDKMDKSSANKGFSLFLDESWISKDIFLYRLCKDFFSLVEEAPVIDGNLLSWAKKLKTMLETSFGWDFHSRTEEMVMEEDDEFSPVVVLPADMEPQDDVA